MNTSKTVLFDSNVLVYAHNKTSPFHHHALQYLDAVNNGQIHGVLTQQNLLEFYSIITDRRRVAKPLTQKIARQLLEEYINSPFEIISPTHEALQKMLFLCKNIHVKNGQIFDVYLVATMMIHKVSTILTANVKDFEYFTKIEILKLQEKFE